MSQTTVRSLYYYSSARQLAAKSIREAQQKYKAQYDKHSSSTDFKIGDWVPVQFPQEETGPQRKLSHPWHGPYRVVSCRDPDITVTKVYYPQDGQIQIHQSRVQECPSNFPAGFFWYGSKRRGPGRPPKWVENLMTDQSGPPTPDSADTVESRYSPRSRDKTC